MKRSESQAKRLKRLTGIIIPALVLAVTAVIVGTSFAWFSDTATAQISVINLTTAEVFTLTFNIDAASGAKEYNGETSFDSKGRLVTPRRALAPQAQGGLGLVSGSSEYNQFVQDAAYVYSAKIKFDTDGRSVGVTLDYDTLTITNVNYRYDENGDPVADENGNPIVESRDIKYQIPFEGPDGVNRYASDIKLGFTWYLKDSAGNVYSPYGIIEPGYLNSAGILESDFKWKGALPERGSTSFNLSASESEVWELCAVFAPEKLYWSQFSYADWKKTVNELYTTEELDKIYDSANNNTSRLQPFYSTYIYTGMEYSLSMSIKTTGFNGGGGL